MRGNLNHGDHTFRLPKSQPLNSPFSPHAVHPLSSSLSLLKTDQTIKRNMRRSSRLLFRSIIRPITATNPSTFPPPNHPIPPRHFLTTTTSPEKNGEEVPVTLQEARRMMRLANVESLKRKLEMGGEEVIRYDELLKECEGAGIARGSDEARSFVKVLDEAGVVLVFRDKVYLHPDKVVDLMKKVVPLALTPENDPRREELKELQKKKENIDMLAHKQVRRILWSGLGFFICQVGVFLRLTFWEFSWDIMEPIAFFTTTTGLIVGYAYFLFTSRDPTYQDLMKRLFFSRQRKLIERQKFDIGRYMELQKRCRCPLDHTSGLELDASYKDL